MVTGGCGTADTRVWLAAPEACPEKTSCDAVQDTCSAAKRRLMEAYKLLTGADHD